MVPVGTWAPAGVYKAAYMPCPAKAGLGTQPTAGASEGLHETGQRQEDCQAGEGGHPVL